MKVTERMKVLAFVDDLYCIRLSLDRARKRIKQLKVPNGKAKGSVGHIRSCVDVVAQGAVLLDQAVWMRWKVE